MSGRELVGIAYSPWSEKARWVLDFHQLPYRYREHLVLLGDALLELRLRRAGLQLSEGATVPVLFEGRSVTVGSFEILLKIDRSVSPENQLCPEGRLPEVKHFNLLAETIMSAGRALYMERLKVSVDAQLASFPPFVPDFLRPALLPLVTQGIESVDEQFGISRKRPSDYSNQLLQCLVGLRKHREYEAQGDFLLGDRFSSADLMAASALSVIRPHRSFAERCPQALVDVWTHPELSREFVDLLEWRDRIYEKYRRAAV